MNGQEFACALITFIQSIGGFSISTQESGFRYPVPGSVLLNSSLPVFSSSISISWVLGKEKCD